MPNAPGFIVEPLDESGGHCDCCGNTSRSIWGLIHNGENTVAAYWLHWTDGHLSDLGANLDMVIGTWGEGTSNNDRVATSLIYREPTDGGPALMVIDARREKFADSDLTNSMLRREDVVGTPLAGQVFALVDAIWLQDARLF